MLAHRESWLDVFLFKFIASRMSLKMLTAIIKNQKISTQCLCCKILENTFTVNVEIFNTSKNT